jgi:hypothetical protein
MTCSSAAAGYDHLRYVGKEGVEVHDRRQPSARHYRAPDGRTVAVITAVPTDFRGDAGSWQRIRPEASSAADGTSQALENAIRMRSHESGITITDRQGRGLTWLLPHQADPRADGADVDIAGTRWSYTLTRYGIKAETVVAAPLGPRTWQFPFALEGGLGEVEIESGGGGGQLSAVY